MPNLSQYQQFIALSRYARWREDDGRRETWEETVKRYFDFFEEMIAGQGHLAERPRLEEAVREMRALPSMRALMTAGPALARDHIAGYNCAYTAVDDPRSFDEIMFVLMNGTGVGFSVERQYVSKLPCIPEELRKSDTVIVVADSRAGWAKAFRQLVALLYAGEVPDWDMHKVRPAGARLKTFGGRASGPGPLEELFHFTVDMFSEAVGRKLTSLECHDLVCKIGEIVVAGGVRRSALISLSNLSDQRMRDAKSGQWWESAPHRQLANNSVAYTERPEVGQFMAEWLALYQSKSGERGIFNREAAAKNAGKSGRRQLLDSAGAPWVWGVNPCSEIVLRPDQFCNLTEVVCRADDTEETLMEKVEVATILGTWQSLLTNFLYLRPSWRRNCEEERLLGVSLTGIMDCPLLNRTTEETRQLLQRMRVHAVRVNAEWADRLNINPAAAITCVKPSGTVSQLVDAASGIHRRHAQFYIRRVRNDRKDPLTQLMIDQGFPHEDDVTNPNTIVFEFPIRSPEGAIIREHSTAIDELEHWLLVQEAWCEHKPSVTVTVRELEWPSVGAWVWEHFDVMSGVSFLPHSGHVYRQAPYEEVTEAELKALEDRMPKADWSRLVDYEREDATTASRELACAGGVCEV